MSSILRKLSWWAADYAFAAYWQCSARFGRARESDYRSGESRPVLVIPGIWETWAFMRPLVEAAHNAGHPVYAMSSLGNNSADVVAAAMAVAEFVDTNDLHDVLIVAHSKGGLIGKYAMALSDHGHRFSGMVAVNSPFSGSRYARYLVLPSVRALSPDDPTIQLLATSSEVNARIVSVYAQFDPHIPEGSELAGAQNIEIPTGGHFRILTRPETVAVVLEKAAAAAD